MFFVVPTSSDDWGWTVSACQIWHWWSLCAETSAIYIPCVEFAQTNCSIKWRQTCHSLFLFFTLVHSNQDQSLTKSVCDPVKHVPDNRTKEGEGFIGAPGKPHDLIQFITVCGFDLLCKFGQTNAHHPSFVVLGNWITSGIRCLTASRVSVLNHSQCRPVDRKTWHWLGRLAWPNPPSEHWSPRESEPQLVFNI